MSCYTHQDCIKLNIRVLVTQPLFYSFDDISSLPEYSEEKKRMVNNIHITCSPGLLWAHL